MEIRPQILEHVIKLLQMRHRRRLHTFFLVPRPQRGLGEIQATFSQGSKPGITRGDVQNMGADHAVVVQLLRDFDRCAQDELSAMRTQR